MNPPFQTIRWLAKHGSVSTWRFQTQPEKYGKSTLRFPLVFPASDYDFCVNTATNEMEPLVDLLGKMYQTMG